MPLELHKPKPGGFPLAFTIIVVLALLFVAFNVFQIFSPGFNVSLPSFNPFQSAPQQQTVPKVTLVQAPNCTNCFDLGGRTASLFSISVETAPSTQTLELVQKYSLTKLPALIISNESVFVAGIYDQVAPLLLRKNGVLILETTAPPFYDVEEQEVKGNVQVISISPDNCPKCLEARALIRDLEGAGVYIANHEQLETSTLRGQELLRKYNLNFAPAFIFSSDLLEYPQFKEAWTRLGSEESDGLLVMRNAFPPYLNLSTNQTEGLVRVTYLTDEACVECYNVTLHKNVLLQYGVYIENETYVDISSAAGTELTIQYNITLVPTVVFSRDAGVYQSLIQVWNNVGSIETDGSLIFRSFSTIPGLTYKDLATNSTLNSTATQQA